MELFVVRHAIAQERRTGLADADRALTDKGRDRFARAVDGLGRMQVELDLILHSPWRRAVQTAQLMARLTERPLTPCAELADDPDHRLLAILAAEEMRELRVALVGHQPWLSELTAWLVTGSLDDAEARFRFKKGAVAHLVGDPQPGAMQLQALIPPRWLRSLV